MSNGYETPSYETIRIDHPKLRKFAPLISPKAKPIKVKMSDKLRPQGCCYWNVAEEIEAHGGVPIYGWQIMYWPKRFIEAMHHAIWKMPDGTLVDVTAKYESDPVKCHTVFIADDRITINLEKPCYVQSKHFPFKDEPAITDFISAYRNKNIAERAMAELSYKYGYRNQGQKATAKGVSFDPSSIQFPLDFQREIAPIHATFQNAMKQLGTAIRRVKALDAANTRGDA
ncbi:hypothetical protein [Pseudoalteromonas arabiensis]|uniref:hypothetical protein n=1 Tax=Pseudoalteromonas arabiensis TaxID=874454 RepID=UPI000781A939|nr:hypothetical protein [Pseudoalteromonas arabiensis]